MTRALAIVPTEAQPPDDSTRLREKLDVLRAGLRDREAELARLRERHSQALDTFAADPADRHEQALHDLTQRLRTAGDRHRLLEEALERLESRLATADRQQAREAARTDMDQAIALVDQKVAAARALDKHLAAAAAAAARYAAIGTDCAARLQAAIAVLHGQDLARAHDALLLLVPRADGKSEAAAGALAGHFRRITTAIGDPVPLGDYVAFNHFSRCLPSLVVAAEQDAASVRKTLEASR